ncbi:hypothetical protein EDD86DRAFT_220312 [Gorgonomyces haynaldii]|nr:hypothetical protein EDD86DRAFT_220312 [Gorgonomyces haynaldii]
MVLTDDSYNRQARSHCHSLNWICHSKHHTPVLSGMQDHVEQRRQWSMHHLGHCRHRDRHRKQTTRGTLFFPAVVQLAVQDHIEPTAIDPETEICGNLKVEQNVVIMLETLVDEKPNAEDKHDGHCPNHFASKESNQGQGHKPGSATNGKVEQSSVEDPVLKGASNTAEGQEAPANDLDGRKEDTEDTNNLLHIDRLGSNLDVWIQAGSGSCFDKARGKYGEAHGAKDDIAKLSDVSELHLGNGIEEIANDSDAMEDGVHGVHEHKRFSVWATKIPQMMATKPAIDFYTRYHFCCCTWKAAKPFPMDTYFGPFLIEKSSKFLDNASSSFRFKPLFSIHVIHTCPPISIVNQDIPMPDALQSSAAKKALVNAVALPIPEDKPDDFKRVTGIFGNKSVDNPTKHKDINTFSAKGLCTAILPRLQILL